MLFTSQSPVTVAVLCHQQHTLNHWQVALMNKAMDAQVTLAGLRLLGQQVTFESFVPADLACAGNSECLLRT